MTVQASVSLLKGEHLNVSCLDVLLLLEGIYRAIKDFIGPLRRTLVMTVVRYLFDLHVVIFLKVGSLDALANSPYYYFRLFIVVSKENLNVDCRTLQV